MPTRVVFCQFVAKDKATRDLLIESLTRAGESALKNEPGTLRYATLVPVDETDEKTLYIIEEYADDDAFNAHMSLPSIKEGGKRIAEGNLLEGEPRIIWELRYVDDFYFVRPEIAKAANPYIVVGELEYKPGTIPTSIPYWKAVVETGRKDEPGTLLYGIAKDPNNENFLYTIEGYESKEYLYDVHVKSEAIQESIKNTKHLRNGLKHHWLKLVGGYLVKGSGSV